jgi:hypothetical protein
MATQPNTATAATPQLRQRITFRQNQTQTVTPEAAGVEQSGNNGIEYRYKLEGNAIMWVPLEVHQAIEAAQAGWPATFEITKHAKGWLTVHIADEPAPAPVPIAAPRPRPNATERALAGIAAPPAQPNLPHTTAAEPYSASMYTALCAAIRTAAAAKEFARSIGRAIAFETGDVRAIAATLFIHASEGGR